MVERILLAARSRQLKSPAESFADAVKSAINDGYAWFKELAIKKVRPSKTPAKAIAAWTKVWNSSFRKAFDGHEEFGNLVGEVAKCAEKFEDFEGAVPEEPLRGNSTKEQFIRFCVLLDRLVTIMSTEFEEITHLLESALEEDGSAEEGLTLEQIICGDKHIRTFLSVALPRIASKNLPPLAYLFIPNEDEPLVGTYSHERFAVLDKSEKRWNWVSKDTGRYECISCLFDEKPEWKRFNGASRAIVFGVGTVPRRNAFRTFHSGGTKRKRARRANSPNTFDN